MNLNLGIVGLPNVGKSTLFNALTANDIPAENYPFCTIEPNVGVVPVEDKRLDKIGEIENSLDIIPSVVKFIDIAGLVKGAAKGEGLGNKFLSHIREVNAIVHVIRRFHDDNVTHVEKSVDPRRDISIIETELIVRDVESIEKRVESLESAARGDEAIANEMNYYKSILNHLNSGNLANSYKEPSDKKEEIWRKSLFLLTDKPFLYLVNEAQEKITSQLSNNINDELGLDKDTEVILMDANLEAELSLLSKDDQQELLKSLDLKERPLNKLIRASHKMLGLLDFFTAGEKEARAWTIYKGDTALEAAAVIHTDFAKNFIAADVAKYEDFVKYNGWNGTKEAGKVTLESKKYKIKDGDILLIRHNA